MGSAGDDRTFKATGNPSEDAGKSAETMRRRDKKSGQRFQMDVALQFTLP